MSSSVSCTSCGVRAPLPVLICHKCQDSPYALPTPYCTTGCRKKDTKKHKFICSANYTRTVLYRSGDLLQAIFYQFREAAFDVNVKDVAKKGRLLQFRQDFDATDSNDGPLFRFPHDKVSNPIDKTTLLAHNACVDACIYMYELSKKLLEDITTTIEEVDFEIKPRHWALNHYLGNDTTPLDPCLHTVLAVEALDGQAYIVDLTGPQLDQHKAVLPFDQYASLYTNRLPRIHPHGHSETEYMEIRERKSDYKRGANFDYRRVQVIHLIRQRMLASVEEWEKANKKTLLKLVRGSQEEFERGKGLLVAKIGQDLQKFVEEWEKGGRRLVEFPGWSQMLEEVPERYESPSVQCTLAPGERHSRAYQKWTEDQGQETQDQAHSRVRLVDRIRGWWKKRQSQSLR